MSDVLDELLRTFGPADPATRGDNGSVRADVGREGRKGVPEVIMADRKRPEDVFLAARAFLDARGRAVLSRVPPGLVEQLRAEFPDSRAEIHAASRMVVPVSYTHLTLPTTPYV